MNVYGLALEDSLQMKLKCLNIFFSLYTCYFKTDIYSKFMGFFKKMMAIFTTVFQFSWPYSSFYLLDKHRSPIMCYTLNSTNESTVHKTEKFSTLMYLTSESGKAEHQQMNM